jgi:hypothetical protein
MSNREFQFDELSHTYRVGGVIVPGVTRVIDHAGLTDYDNVRADILDRRSALGRVVHRCIHFWNQNDLDWATVDERAKGYVESAIMLADDLKLQPRQVECQCVAELNGMLYGMQVDWEGFVGPDEALIDYKITRQAQPHHAIQLAGYALGLPHEKLTSSWARFLARKRFIAKLHEQGKRARLIPYESKNDAKVYESALVTTHWKLLMGKKIEPIELEEAA